MEAELKRSWTVNGEARVVRFLPLARLLDVMRDQMGLLSVKEGCGEGECGTCTLLVNGQPRLACLTAAAQVDDGATLLTAEGLEGDELGRRLMAAYDEAGAVQCGYCTPGMLVGSYHLLRELPNPTEDQVREHLAGHICRCTGYTKIVEAVERCARPEGVAP